MSKKGISVAIITHNREKLLRECLKSLVNQTKRPDEVVIIDNASKDGTDRVIASFKKQLPVQYVYSHKKGFSINRNIALRRAKHQTILWIDDDCTAYPNLVEEAQRCILIGMYLFQGIDEDTYTNVFSSAQNLRTEECRLLFDQLLKDKVVIGKRNAKRIFGVSRPMVFKTINAIDHRCFVYRKEILDELPYWFDESLPSYFSADEWDLLRRVRAAGYQVLLNPRLKVIHHGRTTIPTFASRQFQYGRNDAIREWLDAGRRKKIQKLKPLIQEKDITPFMRTTWLFLKIDGDIMRNLWKRKITALQKSAIGAFFLLGKLIRFCGKMYERLFRIKKLRVRRRTMERQLRAQEEDNRHHRNQSASLSC